MPRFDLAEFLDKTGFSLRRLATYLQVALAYLEAARAGEARLTARDQAACRLLWRRLFRGKQLELPFAEPLETFTRRHARRLARAQAAKSGTTANARPSRRRPPRRAVAPQQPTKPNRGPSGTTSAAARRTGHPADPRLADPM